MDRTPLKSIGNILPNCLTLSGKKKIGITISHNGSQVPRQEASVTVLKPAVMHVPQQSHSESTNGKRSRHSSESDRPTATPGTPVKQSGKPGTPPLTPLANLKVLIAAASTALEKEEQQVEHVEPGEAAKHKEPKDMGEDGGGRKMKSLAILCKRFLSIAETEIGVGVDFSLESMSKKLGTNRRRIYDIINVLEALEMIVKQSKNWYTWLGQGNLLITLAKMKAMAEDDVDFRAILNKENGGTSSIKEPQALHPLPSVSDSLPTSLSPSELSPSQPSAFVEIPTNGNTASGEDMETSSKQQEEPFCLAGDENNGLVSGGRWDKSLGVLCQKFVMLFLVTPDNEVTLDYAGNVLMPDDQSYAPTALTNPKTKVRRLYDIANVLTTLGLIRKKTFLAPNHRKMPGYSWAGPSLDQIKTISVFRKSEANLYPFYSKRRGNGGTSLTRKPSFGSVRPFLHQYEVKGGPGVPGGPSNTGPSNVTTTTKSPLQPSSAPSSPVKFKESGFKRSLSFGAGTAKKQLPKAAQPQSSPVTGLASKQQVAMPTPTSTSQATPTVSEGELPSSSSEKCAVQQQLPQQQVDYLQEVVEFETELLKHTHKYPHIAPFFHDFVVRFYNTLRQAALKISEPTATPLGNTPIVGVAGLNHAAIMTSSASIATSYAEIMSPSMQPSMNATPPSENILPTTPILNSVNLDHASFNPNSLLVTSPTAYTFLPTTTASSPSFFPFYTSSLSPVAMMAAALGRTATVVTPTTSRSLAPKPSVPLGEQATAAAEISSNPAKKAKLESS